MRLLCTSGARTQALRQVCSLVNPGCLPITPRVFDCIEVQVLVGISVQAMTSLEIIGFNATTMDNGNSRDHRRPSDGVDRADTTSSFVCGRFIQMEYGVVARS